MRYECRPLGPWLEPVTANRQSGARFRASWDSTLDLLGTEVGLLGGDLIVVQVDAEATDIRRDGMLRSRARVGFPGVRVSFDSRYGPLTYATDRYEQTFWSDMPSWQANVRAIALSLEALRAVDRHGVTHRGEQYVGWTALPAAGQEPMTPDDAARLLAGAAPGFTQKDVAADPQVRARAFKTAARQLHPDAGGDPELFRRLTEARDLLDRLAGGNR